MSAEKSINTCIKTTLGPTFAIFWGSGKGCFFGCFPIAEKCAKEWLDISLGAARGGKMAPGGSAAAGQPLGKDSTKGSVLAGWSLGLASRARG